MKGPYERLKYDFRRVWECPICRHRDCADGCVTAMFCHCQRKQPTDQRVAMKLVEDAPRRVSTPSEPAPGAETAADGQSGKP
jgi:hypothetical protein